MGKRRNKGNREGRRETSAHKCFTIAGMHLVEVRAVGTLGLRLTAYATDRCMKEEGMFVLDRRRADWVSANEKGVRE